VSMQGESLVVDAACEGLQVTLKAVR
jgi:hypothetical protein